MSSYRGELRVFGLIAMFILACLLLYGGLSSAKIDGEALGFEYSVGGPAGLFVILFLLSSWRGLLTFELSEGAADIVNRPIDKMSIQDAERAVDDLQSEINALERHRARMAEYVSRLNEGRSVDESMLAIGIQPARRGGGE